MNNIQNRFSYIHNSKVFSLFKDGDSYDSRNKSNAPKITLK
jgi:hypothetical protein